MPRLSDLKVKLFTDGADKAQILEMARQSWIVDFTTNPSLLKKAGVSNYVAYGRDLVTAVSDRHTSFEIFSDDIPEMMAIEGKWLMLQQPEPDDYVLAAGETHTVREFIEQAFGIVGRRIEWRGSGLDEVGIDVDSNKVLIEVDSRYFRPTEVDALIGDASKARERLGWRPRVSFKELVTEMVQSDLKLAGLSASK